jgi:hypothetical protein
MILETFYQILAAEAKRQESKPEGNKSWVPRVARKYEGLFKRRN